MVTIAMTATLLPGDQTRRVCEFVGLEDYHAHCAAVQPTVGNPAPLPCAQLRC